MQHSIVNYSPPAVCYISRIYLFYNSKFLPFNWNHITQIGTWTQALELEASQNPHWDFNLLTEITLGLRT